MTFKEVIPHSFLLVACFLCSLVYAVEDGATPKEEPAPKAIPVPKV